ncbi:MAG: NAD(P)-dependent oxidoreductase [Verrucomicrobiae bacterium]|nr:NAD(P)-dependent oxidoreductase [Verrucomicrobiae bacterium]
MNPDLAPFTSTRVGIVGTGFMARGVAHVIVAAGLTLGPVLTRRPEDSSFSFPVRAQFTNEVAQLVDQSDLIVECSGDPVHATNVVAQAMDAGIPVVTMNSEFHVTTGSWFVGKGVLTEGEGDQPGCLAALRREALSLGFTPLVYGNVKGFLNHNPSRSDMEYFAGKQGTSITQTTSFTDGTKLQIEQAFVANAFGTDIYRPGLLGPAAETIEEGAETLAGVADMHGAPISDYIILPGCGAVFIAARHENFHRPYLSYMKMGDGPYYTLTKQYHLCHLEVIKTIQEVLRFGPDGVLMDNSKTPRVSVAAIAKRDLPQDFLIEQGIGSFDFRGEAVEIADQPDHVPVGLLKGARLTRRISRGQRLTMRDIEIPDSLAHDIWKKLVVKASQQAA